MQKYGGNKHVLEEVNSKPIHIQIHQYTKATANKIKVLISNNTNNKVNAGTLKLSATVHQN